MTTEPDPFVDQVDGVRDCAAPHIERFELTDFEGARRFFATAFTPGWPLTGVSCPFSVTARRQAAGAITIDEFVVEGSMVCEVSAADSVIVIQPRAGALMVAGESLAGPEPVLLAGDMLPCTVTADPAQFYVISIDADILRKIAAEINLALVQRIQFRSVIPLSATTPGAWHRALDYVIAVFNAPDAGPGPLIHAATRVLTAATLECFPSLMTAGLDLPATARTVSKTLKDAVAFMHNHADHDMGINDIAAAVNLTPRAVQRLFRQEVTMTPMEYLRRIRLHLARADLMKGDRSSTTVAAVAHKWRFSQLGRFAAHYRQAYGEPPSTTLAKVERSARLVRPECRYT